MLLNLIGGFIVILIGINLASVIADSIFDTVSNADVAASASSVAIINLCTIFFAIGVMSSGIALATSGLKNAGLI